MHPNVDSRTIAKSWKQPKNCGSKTVLHLHSGIQRSRKKEGTPILHDRMELESIMLSEISQAGQEKYL